MRTYGKAVLSGSDLSSGRSGKLRASLATGQAFLWRHGQDLVELVALLAWALFVGKAFLDMDPNWLPWGGEFPMETQSHYVWTLLFRCGTCVFWNGFSGGGSPAFVDLHGAALHPLTVLTTLIWGVVNGGKVTMVICLFLAGLAQWWLAKTLQLGGIARMWSSFLAVAGGHLAGRMQNGLLVMVISLVFSALLIPAILRLTTNPSRRSALVLGVLSAFVLLSGQGYIQAGIVLGVIPAALVYWIDRTSAIGHLLRRLALSALVACLLSAVLWVPLLHFAPNLAKDGDPTLSYSQPLEYLPLNLVIRDQTFYENPSLEKFPAPVLYILYIGWLPVLLALVTISWGGGTRNRRLAFFLIAIFLVFFFGSSTGMRALDAIVPGIAPSIRHPSLIAGIAVPLLLGLAAWGLDLLVHADWLRVHLSLKRIPDFSFNATYLIAVIPLLISIRAAYDWSQKYYWMSPLPSEYPPSLSMLTTDSAEWVAPPFGEYFWYPMTLGRGMKLGNTFRPWHWRDRTAPPFYVEGTRDPAGLSSPYYAETRNDIHWMVYPQNAYATVNLTSGEAVPCAAVSQGGRIDVDCQTTVDGVLVVHENSTRDWHVEVDSHAASLLPGQWLSVPAPAGAHHFSFRYRPWDVWLGLALAVLGIIIVLAGWWAKETRVSPERPADEPGEIHRP
jgi:hypothetical protein